MLKKRIIYILLLIPVVVLLVLVLWFIGFWMLVTFDSSMTLLDLVYSVWIGIFISWIVVWVARFTISYRNIPLSSLLWLPMNYDRSPELFEQNNERIPSIKEEVNTIGNSNLMKEWIKEKEYLIPISGRKLIVFSLVMWLLIYIFFVDTWWQYPGMSVLLFHLFFRWWVYVIFWYKEKSFWSSVRWVGVLILTTSLWFAVYTNESLFLIQVLFLLILDVILLLLLSGKLLSDDFGFKWLRYVCAYIVQLFSWISAYFALPLDWIKNMRAFTITKNQKFNQGIRAWGILLWLLCLIIPLLASADKVFNNLLYEYIAFPLERFFSSFSIWNMWWDVLWILLSSFFMLWVIYTYFAYKKPNVLKKYDIYIWSIYQYVILWWVNVVYLLFVIIQFTFFFFWSHDLLVEYWIDSYSSYVHSWFWQLIWISAINGIIYMLFQWQKEWLIWIRKILLWILVWNTLVILLSAAMRVILYIWSYWMTRLRIWVVSWIILIFLIYITLFLRLFFSKIKIDQYVIFLLFAFWLPFSFSNIDEKIADFNLRYHEVVVDWVESRSTKLISYLGSREWFKKKTYLDATYIFSLSKDAYLSQIYTDKKLWNNIKFPNDSSFCITDVPRYRFNYIIRQYNHLRCASEKDIQE